MRLILFLHLEKVTFPLCISKDCHISYFVKLKRTLHITWRQRENIGPVQYLNKSSAEPQILLGFFWLSKIIPV
jgi:hypothetical protein